MATASRIEANRKFDPGPGAERLRRSQAAKSRELRQTLELLLKMQAARDKRKISTSEGTEGTEGRGRRDPECANEADSGKDKRKSLTTEGTEGTEGRRRGDQGCANEADSGGRMGTCGEGSGTVEDRDELTTEGTEGGGPRDEAESVSREGGIGGRAGEGRTIPGRKRIPAREAVGGSEAGCGGEKKAPSEANLAMIKQLMAQRFSDMPAARGARRTNPNRDRRYLSWRGGQRAYEPASGRELKGVPVCRGRLMTRAAGW